RRDLCALAGEHELAGGVSGEAEEVGDLLFVSRLGGGDVGPIGLLKLAPAWEHQLTTYGGCEATAAAYGGGISVVDAVHAEHRRQVGGHGVHRHVHEADRLVALLRDGDAALGAEVCRLD